MAVKIRNKDRLLKKLGMLHPALFEAIEKANHQAADEMVDLAQAFVPKGRTGKLRESIVATPPGQVPPSYSQGGGHAPVPEGAYAVSAGNTAVRYAHLVEWGTKPHPQGGMFKGTEHPGTPPRTFFWNSYRIIRKKHRGRIGRALGKSVKAIAAK